MQGAELRAVLPPSLRWTVVAEMSVSRSAAGVTVFDGRVFVSGGHDGLQIFNTVGLTVSCPAVGACPSHL